MDVEIISFAVPSNKDNVVYLPKIKWDASQEELWKEINDIFSTFGLIFHIFISQTKFGCDELEWFFAYIRYYSKTAVKHALKHSGKILLCRQNLIISRPTKDYNFSYTKLAPYKAEELLSYYFGFNYWSSEITNLHKESDDSAASDIIKFICKVRITTKDSLWSEGVGVGQADIGIGKDIGKSYMAARRAAVYNAKSDAFSKFLIVELQNGKRLLEVDTTKPDMFCLNSLNENIAIETIGQLSDDPEELEEGEWIENLSDSAIEEILGV